MVLVDSRNPGTLKPAIRPPTDVFGTNDRRLTGPTPLVVETATSDGRTMPEHLSAFAPKAELDDFWDALRDAGRDLPALLRTIAQRVVTVIGDGCVLTTVSADATELRPEVILHADEEVGAAIRTVLGAGSVRIGEGVAGSVAADRHAVLLNDLEPDTVAETTPDRFLPFLRDHPMRALMIVPLVAGEELVGTLGAVRTTSARGYEVADLRMLEALADRAALAIAQSLGAPTRVTAADYEAIYRHNLDGVLLTTPDGHILAANPAACSLLRMAERQIVAGGREALVIADPKLERALAERATAGHARAELPIRRGDGTTFVADVSSTIFTTPEGALRASVILRDVTAEVASRERAISRLAELEDLADRDPLTGLLNRRGFAIACHQVLASADRRGAPSQFVFVDVDHLKEINDTDGHSAGDAALVAVASSIQLVVREADVTARVGGDEFAILLAATRSGEVRHIIDRLRAQLAADGSTRPRLSISVGVAERSARDTRRLDDVVDAADRAMYQERMLRRLRDNQRRSRRSVEPNAAALARDE
jgi:diguanylate cyclase (GGDEF)-like protein/PAS domain S-box-containing protein